MERSDRGAEHVPDFPYARYDELIGLKGVMINRPEQIAAAWEEALAADRPCVIEAITDAEAPPLPPHVTFDQAKAFVESMLQGDSSTRGILRQSARDAGASLFSSGRD